MLANHVQSGGMERTKKKASRLKPGGGKRGHNHGTGTEELPKNKNKPPRRKEENAPLSRLENVL